MAHHPRAKSILRRLRRSIAALAAIGSFSVIAHEAAAQTTDRVQAANGDGMDQHLFRPAIDSKGFFAVNGADILGHLDFSLGLVLDYGYNQLHLNDGHGSDVLLRHAFQGTLQVDLGLFNWVVLGISAPVILNGGDAVTDIGPTGATYGDDSLEGQALGHVAGHVKLRLLRPEAGSPLGLAILAQAGAEVGGSRNFGAEPGFFYWPQLILEKRLVDNRLRFGLNGGYRGHTGKNPQFGLGADGQSQLKKGVLEYSDLLTFGFATSFRVLDPLDLVAETYGSFQLGGGSDDRQRLSMEAIGGLKLFIEKNSYLMAAGGVGYLQGFQAADVRATLGFVFEPSIGDRDGDGIKDDQDDCPDDPEDFDGFQDTRDDSPPKQYGCPEPDNDEDGIPDKQDACPTNPEDKDNDRDTDGCPEGSDGDMDGDGILDVNDKCPKIKEDQDGYMDRDGCPDPDNDGDGILDVDEECDNDPEDKDNWEDTDGCPDPDNDRDGIPDIAEGSDDQGNCMNRAEVVNGLNDEDGCPDQSSVVISENEVLILDKILFKTGSAQILNESMKVVDLVAETLKRSPQFTLVEVQGHADVRAPDALNLKLTQDRSKAVLDALVKKGVAANRLRSMGYGEYCPLDPAENDAAYEKNRRVEFKIVRKDGQPTGVSLGCDAAVKKGVVPAAP